VQPRCPQADQPRLAALSVSARRTCSPYAIVWRTKHNTLRLYGMPSGGSVVASFSNRQNPAAHRQRIWRRLQQLVESSVEGIKIIIAVGGLALVILLSIPWLSGPLAKIGLTSSTSFDQDVLAVIVVAIFFDVRRLIAKKPQDPHHFPDPMAVYPVLQERISSITRKEEKKLDVLGMTLYTAWPSIRFWLNRPEFNGWTVRLSALAGNEVALGSHVPATWFREARSNLDSVMEYASAPSTLERKINLQAYEYDFMPSLHGYRLGNGDLFYSILYWDENGLLSLDNYSYEFVSADNFSPSAIAIRQVFQSWFERATKTLWSPTAPHKGLSDVPLVTFGQ
jgi:hypothetical protein